MIIRASGVTDGNPVVGWRNVVTASNIAATTAAADFPVTNLANPSTHLRWQSAANVTSEYITISGINETLSYLAVAQHYFGSAGLTCTVETTLNGSTWVTAVPAIAITDNMPLLFQWAPVANCVGVRLRMQGPGTTPGAAAVLYAGSITTLERSVRIDLNHTPINLATVSDIVSGMAESGQFLGRLVRNQYKDSKIDFWYFTNSFYRAEIDAFIIAAVENPFFMSWAPAIYPTDTGYCWLTKDPRPEMHLPTDRFIVSLEMRGIA
jgi:hypothetical protein